MNTAVFSASKPPKFNVFKNKTLDVSKFISLIKENYKKSTFYAFCTMVQLRGGIRLIKGRIKKLFRAPPGPPGLNCFFWSRDKLVTLRLSHAGRARRPRSLE